MKKNILILLLNFCLFSCYSQKKTSDIIYFLPSSVTEILIKELQKRGIENKVYVVLDKENKDTYILYLNNFSISSENFWVENSNRSVFIEKKLIPLYFYADEYLSFAEKGENVLKKLGTEENIKRVINIRENTFSIKFKLNGEIIK
ncbi:hypothetical protein MKJ01_17495 [Chryseobacterium sp. SSA4.19]|uniref:hypothetical protein n=1 Tax=Chryseobacterium sp. SSA4.19 TaxID=2919915 RepID=UPI001F4D99E2|nr:hypothetical protein [Chryseobacterium sp. SSA4.19]MCJ8155556.1 hypothetical protein [Chryseobacterium sp. SSA4.19]